MINDEFVEEFIREVEMELASLAPVEKAVEDALDSMKSEIDPNVKIDESMLYSVKQKAKSEGYNCVGGEFMIHYVDDAHFKVSYDLYMQDNKKQWIKRSSSSGTQSNVCLTDNSAAELKEKGKVVYAIDPPTGNKN